MSKNVQEMHRRTVTKHVVREWEEHGKQLSQSIAQVIVEYQRKTYNGEPSPQGSDGVSHTIDIELSGSTLRVEDWPLVVVAVSEAISESVADGGGIPLPQVPA